MKYNKFTTKVDTRSRKAMANFLTNHFRYYTMNSWNVSMSWANNVKIYKLGLPTEIENKLYDMLDVEYWDSDLRLFIDDLIRDFEMKTGYTAGFNGRSDGYLVLYDTDIVNGKLQCHNRSVDDYTFDEYMDKDEFDMQDLRNKVKLVQEFDELCNRIIDECIYFAENYEVVEEKYTVTKTRKVLQEVNMKA